MDETIIPAKSEPKNLIFLFHGYGSDKDNFYPIGKLFSEAIPTTEIHIANGIEPCEESSGYKWFPMTSNDVNILGNSMNSNIPTMKNYIDSVMDGKNLTYQDVILSGFSQGAMLSLALGISLNVKAVVAFSGMFLAPEKYLKQADTKVLLTHGKDDDVIPIEAVDYTKIALESFDINTKVIISENLGHAINEYLLDQTVDFLKSL